MLCIVIVARVHVCVVIVVHVHVLCYYSGMCTCFVLLQWYMYVFVLL